MKKINNYQCNKIVRHNKIVIATVLKIIITIHNKMYFAIQFTSKQMKNLYKIIKKIITMMNKILIFKIVIIIIIKIIIINKKINNNNNKIVIF